MWSGGGGAPSGSIVGERLAEALIAFLGHRCHPGVGSAASVAVMDACLMADRSIGIEAGTAERVDADALVIRLFREEGPSLVRMARLFVDDRNAAEDLVQEAFIRLGRAAHRIDAPEKAAAYLRSIVLNLARDHNRRGLVSLRHRPPPDDDPSSTEDEIVLREDQMVVIDALKELPHRQRDCLVLRYYLELGIADIAETLGVSQNSVKTHLRRGLARLEERLGVRP